MLKQPIDTMSVHTRLAFLNTALTRILTDRPEAIAVVEGEVFLNYQQLFEDARCLSSELAAVGMVAGQRLALDAPRSCGLYRMVVACLLSGISFIPVPRTMTVQQKRQFAASTGCAAIYSHAGVFGELCAVQVERGWIGMMPQDVVQATVNPEEIYCVRTSGTTGEPKIVPIYVLQLSAYLENIGTEMTIPFGLNWSWIHDLSFDFSLWELFGCMIHGGCLVVLTEQGKRDPAAAWQTLRSTGVNLLSVTPSEFRYLFAGQPPQALNQLALDTVVFCGEKLTAETLRSFFVAFDALQVRLINAYGPSEATVFCSTHTVTAQDFHHDVIPIGKPFPGMTFSLEECEEDGSGNLLLRGDQVFAGYEGQPPLTAGYLTGDICRCDSVGEYHYVGRKAGYYKINGFRVDPLEIEEFLQSVHGVCEAVVWLEEAQDLPPLLFACINVMPGVGLTTRELRNACVQLSPWLRPARYSIVPQREWPMNAHGKTDRTELKRRQYDA